MRFYCTTCKHSPSQNTVLYRTVILWSTKRIVMSRWLFANTTNRWISWSGSHKSSKKSSGAVTASPHVGMPAQTAWNRSHIVFNNSLRNSFRQIKALRERLKTEVKVLLITYIMVKIYFHSTAKITLVLLITFFCKVKIYFSTVQYI